MDAYDKIKKLFKYSKNGFRPSRRVILLSAALFLFLLLAVTAAPYLLPMEARGGVDFNSRSIYPLTSYVEKGEPVSVRFNVCTHSPWLYGLKVYSPEGKTVA